MITKEFPKELQSVFLPLIDYVENRSTIQEINNDFFNRAIKELKKELGIPENEGMFANPDSVSIEFSKLFHPKKLDSIATALSRMKENIIDPQVFAFMEAMINSGSTALENIQKEYTTAMHYRYILGTGVAAVNTYDIVYNQKDVQKINPYTISEIIEKLNTLVKNQNLLDVAESEKKGLEIIKQKLEIMQQDFNLDKDILSKKEILNLFLKTPQNERSVLEFIEKHNSTVLGADEISYLLSKGTFNQMFGSHGLMTMLPNKVDRLQEAINKYDLIQDFIKTSHISPINSQENKMQMLFLGIIDSGIEVDILASQHYKQITQYLTGVYLSNKYESDIDQKKQKLLQMYGGCSDNNQSKAFQYIEMITQALGINPVRSNHIDQQDRIKNLQKVKKMLIEHGVTCVNEMINKSTVLKVTDGKIYYREAADGKNQIFDQTQYLHAMRDGLLSLLSIPGFIKSLPSSFTINSEGMHTNNIEPDKNKNLPGRL